MTSDEEQFLVMNELSMVAWFMRDAYDPVSSVIDYMTGRCFLWRYTIHELSSSVCQSQRLPIPSPFWSIWKTTSISNPKLTQENVTDLDRLACFVHEAPKAKTRIPQHL